MDETLCLDDRRGKEVRRSSTLDRTDWNAELVRGDLGNGVQQFTWEPGKGLLVGGVRLPQALAELGLIDEYEFMSRLEFGSGAVAMRYEPKR